MGTITVTSDATDYVFMTDSVKPDNVTYAYSGSTLALPKFLLVRRTYPKKTGTQTSNARYEAKVTWNVADPVEGLATPIIVRCEASWRPDLDTAGPTLARKILAQSLLDSELSNFFTTLQLPV